MAKKIKPVVAETKKVEEVKPELPKVEKVETLVGDIEVLASESTSPVPIIEQPKAEDVPPLVTLDETKQVKDDFFDGKELVSKIEINVDEPIKEELPMDEKIKNFIESRPIGEIKMNDFLKSLFGVAKLGEPPLWQNQGATKQIKAVLDKLHNAGEIEVCGNAYMKLGMTYYPDTETMRAAQYDLGSVPIFCKKVN